MDLQSSLQHAELTAPTAELRRTMAELRREIDILRRREQIQESKLNRISREVEQAARLQRQFGADALPVVHGAEICAFSRAAEGISGDFHLVRRIDDETVAILVADATGHGLSAGLMSSMLMGALHAKGNAEESEWTDPAAVLERLHRRVMDCHLPDCEFVAAISATYNERTRVVRWARAGAPYPILLQRGATAEQLTCGGLPLGVDSPGMFSCSEIQLQSGETIVFLSDGLECLFDQTGGDGSGGSFQEWVAALHRTNLRETLAKIINEAGPQSDAPVEFDDITLLSLQVH